ARGGAGDQGGELRGERRPYGGPAPEALHHDRRDPVRHDARHPPLDADRLGGAAMSADCVFCKIRDGQSPAMKVYEDERTLVFMDINPLNAGHCLVTIRNHAATIWDADDADLEAAITVAKQVALALREAVKPDGLNVLQANGAAAFQSVPHFHLHLIPRWNNDGKGFDWKTVAGDRGQIMKVSEKLGRVLAGGTA